MPTKRRSKSPIRHRFHQGFRRGKTHYIVEQISVLLLLARQRVSLLVYSSVRQFCGMLDMFDMLDMLDILCDASSSVLHDQNISNV